MYRNGELSLDQLKSLRSMFVFIVSPIKANKKSFICHVHFAETGVFNDITMNLIGVLLNALEEKEIHIVGFAYDGDPALSKAYTPTYFEYILKKIKDRHGYSWADWIFKFKFPMKVPDGLHCLKRVKNFVMDT